MLDDGHEHVDRDSDPYLAFDRILGCPEETLDAQMLLDPLEEQLHLPSAFVEAADCERGKAEVVGEEHQRLAGLGILDSECAAVARVARWE